MSTDISAEHAQPLPTAEDTRSTDVARAYEASIRKRKMQVLVCRALFGVGLLLLWQYASGRLIDPFFISSPSLIAGRLFKWVSTGEIWPHLLVTVQAMASGFLIGSIVGFTVGVIFGRFHFMADVLDPYITMFYSLPMVALAPLFIMWFGIGISSKIAVSATIVFFVVFLNTFSGIRQVNPIYVHATQIMGASRWQVTRTVMLPSAAAWMIAALKVSVPNSLVGTVVGEFMSANRGIGFLIAEGTGLFDTNTVFAGLVVLCIIAGVANAAVKRAEQYLLRWQ